MNNLNWFEQKVFKGISDCRINLEEIKLQHKTVAAAVSGGADSVSMLVSLCVILKSFEIPLKVITVNHFIRPDEETCGDADFVLKLCSDLKGSGFSVEAELYELEKGQVASFAGKNGYSIEEAARMLRYDLFEKFIQKENAAVLCLAHNKNDQMETVLMRFLQGADCDSSSGIPLVRENFIRPLLNINRSEIELYLREKNLTWRIDSTNSDNNYLRNRIRNLLVPFLNENFSGWQNSVETGIEKSLLDKEIIEQNLQAFPVKLDYEKKEALIKKSDFNQVPDGLKNRVLVKAMNFAGEERRIPLGFLKDVIDSEMKSGENHEFKKIFDDVEIDVKKEELLVKKACKTETETYFSVIIGKDSPGNGSFIFGNTDFTYEKNPEGIKFVTEESENGGKSEYLIKCSFPLRVRSYCAGDEVYDSTGHLKKINEIFSSWHIPEEKRSLIPLVEELGKENGIICILGSFLGFKDWIVK